MKEFKGTPGQWAVTTWTDVGFSNVASSIYHQISSGSGYFDDISKRGFALTGFMTHYDAKLIAAAPDLLEALQGYMAAVSEMNEAMKDGYNVQGAMSKLIGWEDMARAAISKALGE